MNIKLFFDKLKTINEEINLYNSEVQKFNENLKIKVELFVKEFPAFYENGKFPSFTMNTQKLIESSQHLDEKKELLTNKINVIKFNKKFNEKFITRITKKDTPKEYLELLISKLEQNYKHNSYDLNYNISNEEALRTPMINKFEEYFDIESEKMEASTSPLPWRY